VLYQRPFAATMVPACCNSSHSAASNTSAVILPLEIAIAPLLGKHMLINRYVVLRQVAIAEFFLAGDQWPVVAVIPPVLEYAVKPGTIHLFGRRHALQKV